MAFSNETSKGTLDDGSTKGESRHDTKAATMLERGFEQRQRSDSRSSQRLDNEDNNGPPPNFRRPSQLNSAPARTTAQPDFSVGNAFPWRRPPSQGKRLPSVGSPGTPRSSVPQPKEDSFNHNIEIRLRHSVGSMSISPTSRDVVLAGRQGLLIIDLEDPWLPPRILPHMSKWEVADVQWSPYVSRESWVASTSNQRLLVWNLNYSGSQAIEHVLHAHGRAISDINWSPHHPDMLATCSVDTYVHIWDLRCAGQSQEADSGRTMRPVNSFTSWNAGSTQVKFNRKSEFLLASAHDTDVKIWDIRKGAVPLTTISGHLKKVYGIDWSRTNDHDIVTCSLDKLVKYWNINSPEKEQEVIVTNTPVWRARNTPFGTGILTMPQRSESTLYLYNRSSPQSPVHAFEGHKDTVKEFVWRWKGGNGTDGDDREFQLVTWSKDQQLRLWQINEEILKSVGHQPSAKKTCYPVPANTIRPDGTFPTRSFQQAPYENDVDGLSSASSAGGVASLWSSRGDKPPAMTPFLSPAPVPGSLGFTNGNDAMSNTYREKPAINPLLWMQNVKTVGPTTELRRATTTEKTYQTVAEEMSEVLNKYSSAGVKTEKVNAASRTCTISLHGPWSDAGSTFLRITIRFSAQYPDNHPPEFEIQKNSMMSIYYRAHMAQDLNALASSYTSQKRWCLEACIRYLLGETIQEEGELGLSAPGLSSKSSTGQSGGYGSNWKHADNGDSDDEIFAGPSFLGGPNNGYTMNGKRVSLQSEKGIVVDLSSKQSADEKVPFPRLCGGVFSGSGQLVCFFSTLRVRDSKHGQRNQDRSRNKLESEQERSPTSNANGSEYFENTYSDFYKHPRTYEQFEEYKEIAAMSRQGRSATVLVGGSGGAFGEYAYDDDPDDIDDGLSSMAPLYFKPGSLAVNGSLSTNDDLLYRSSKPDHITYNVVLTDLSDIMPNSPVLAQHYILSTSDPAAVCAHNAQVCKAQERYDLHKIWLLALEVIRECVPLDDVDDDLSLTANSQQTRTVAQKGNKRRVHWGRHPLGRKLVDNLLHHFIRVGDVQTAAMLSCVFRIQRNKTNSIKQLKPFFGESLLQRVQQQKQLPGRPNAQALLRTGSGPTPGTARSPDRPSSGQLSSSYGTKGVNIFSYFWDSERHPPRDEESRQSAAQVESTPVAPTANYLSRPFTAAFPPQRLPTNTAPGQRTVARHLGSSMALSLPQTSDAVVAALDPSLSSFVADKEGKMVQPDEMKIEYTNLDSFDGERLFISDQDIPLVDPMRTAQLDVLCVAYADMLFRWGLLEQRAEVLKFLSRPIPMANKRTLQVQIRCYRCSAEVTDKDRVCRTCRKRRTQIQCSVCHILVRGMMNFCLRCGHGGHSAHIRDWFSKDTVCPTGCGCPCIFETAGMAV